MPKWYKKSRLKIIWFLGDSEFHLEITQVKNLSSLFSNFHRTSLTTKNILGIAHPKHSILLMVGRFLEGNLGYFALLVASNQIYFL